MKPIYLILHRQTQRWDYGRGYRLRFSLLLSLLCTCVMVIGCSDLININVSIKDSANQPEVEEAVATPQSQRPEEAVNSPPTQVPSDESSPVLDTSNLDESNVELVPLQEVQSISAGADHACVLTDAGAVQCWGSNRDGQLGAGPIPTSSTAQGVIGLANGVAAVIAGTNHTCALLLTGKAKCWGKNLTGQLGNMNTVNRNGPTDVLGIEESIQSLALGVGHTCALSDAGGVRCWGKNEYGQLGDGSLKNRNTPVGVAGLSSGVSGIASGGSHTCAITIEGGVKCWGANQYGQLGNRTVADQSKPVDVVSLSGGVMAIAASQGSTDVAQTDLTQTDVTQTDAAHTCALLTEGDVKCWGSNQWGQLGDGTTVDSGVPVDVLGLETDIVAIAVGALHACALSERGSVACWGANLKGELGATDSQQNARAVALDGPASDILAISAGSSYTCAVSVLGAVQCWGSNLYGQLGDGSVRASARPLKVAELDNSVDKIVAGDQYNCVLLLDGQVKCWGNNEHGKLGNGTEGAFDHMPAAVERLAADVVDIAGKYEHTCALTTTGEVWCWGNNFRGQLAMQEEYSPLPVPISGLDSEIRAIATGHKLTCALTVEGGLKCWGRHLGLDLETPDSGRSTSPIELKGLTSDIQSVSLGHHHSCILQRAGSVECWGKDARVELGDGSTTTDEGHGRLPVPVYGLSEGIDAVDAGVNNSCALTEKGRVKCWGQNMHGQAGNGTAGRGQSWSTPVDVVGLDRGVVEIAVGANHICVLTEAGTVQCWGKNEDGELGDGTNGNRSVPVDVVDLQDEISAVAAGHDHSCAISIDGAVWCWGANTMGQLGIESLHESSVPQDVMVEQSP